MTTSQARVLLQSARPSLRIPSSWSTAAVAATCAALASYVIVSRPDEWRLGLAVVILMNLLVIAMRWPRVAIAITLVYLPLMALVRRLLIEQAGWTSNDPLLLVGPTVALFVLYRVYFVEKRPLRLDLLTKLVLGLLALCIIQVFNPLGAGGVVAGAGGLMFLAVPLLWFLIGREIADRQLIKVLTIGAIVLAAVVGLYGMWQTEFGTMPWWDVTWLNEAGYNGLRVGAPTENNNLGVRPWSTFSSNSEYSSFLSVGLVFAIALLMHRRLWALLALPVLCFAIFYAGGRSALVLSLLTLVVLAGFRSRNLAVALMIVVAGIGSVYAFGAAFGDRLDQAAGLTGDAIVERNVTGVLNPLDPSKSTFLTHWSALSSGIIDGFKRPAGFGTGSTNLSITQLTDDKKSEFRETDADVSDVFVSLGALGGVVFISIIVLSLKAVFGRYLRKPDPLVFVAMGIMVVTLLQWLNGGHYAVTAYTWIFIGWASRGELWRSDGEGET